MGKLVDNHFNSKNRNCNVEDNKDASTEKFVLVQESQMDSIIQILKERLPRSGHIYNCALRLTKAPGEFFMYTYNGDISSNSWIIVIVSKAHGGFQCISISQPINPLITYKIKQAFIETKLINWEQRYMFSALERPVSLMILEIAAVVKGRGVEVKPNFVYYMTAEDARQLEIEIPRAEGQEVIVKSMDIHDGAEFLTTGWKYGTEDAFQYAKTIVSRHPSTGVYLNGKLVSGVATHSYLLIGILKTDQEYRNRGFAQICMKSHLKSLGVEGYFPTSTLEQENVASNKFHLKCGMKLSHECDYIWYQPKKY